MKCPSCGTENEEGMKFCGECGTPLPQEKKCPACGAMVPLKMKFCGECGCRMDGTSSSGADGVSIGDKNVIAGDVIGKKEQYNVSGNATIIHNEDESKKVLKCSICGKHLLNAEAITCSKCGKIVCEEHFDSAHNCCTNCAKETFSSASSEYNEALKRVYEDGRVDLKERKELTALAKKLGLSKTEADNLESAFLNSTGSDEELLPNEKLAIEEAENALLHLTIAQAKESAIKLEPFFEKLQTNERYLAVYLRTLRFHNPRKDVEIIKKLNADFEPAMEIAAKLYIDVSFEADAKVAVDKMKQLFPNSPLTKCVTILYLNYQYAKTKNESLIEEMKNIASSLKDSSDPYTQMNIEEARWNVEHPGWIRVFYEDLVSRILVSNQDINFFAVGSGNGILADMYQAFFDICSVSIYKKPRPRYKFSLDLSSVEERDMTVKLKFADGTSTEKLGPRREIIDVLQYIVLPKGMTELQNGFLSGFTGLKHIEIPDTVTTIGDYALGKSGLEEIYLPGSIQKIGNAAFTLCSKLKKITIAEGVKEIPIFAFFDCASLEEVHLPESVTFIDKLAFANCPRLKTFEFPGKSIDCSFLSKFKDSKGALSYNVNLEKGILEPTSSAKPNANAAPKNKKLSKAKEMLSNLGFTK